MYIEPLLYSQSKAAHSTIVYLLYTIYTIYILYILYTILYTISAALCGNMVANGYKQKLNTYICCLIIFFIFPGICNENQYKCDDGAGCYSKVSYIWLLVVGIIHDVSRLT